MSEGKCATSKNTMGAMIQVTPSTCWQHVHPDTLNVYEFSKYALRHCPERLPKIVNWFTRNKYTALAETGSHVFKYTGTPQKWKDFKKNSYLFQNTRYVFLKYVGRLGDSVQFQNLDSDLQTLPMADALGVESTESTVAFDACGSRAEVKNNPLRGNTLHFSTGRCKTFHETTELRQLLSPYVNARRGKEYVFTNVVLKSKDQLRHRVAWALSQILVFSDVVSPSSLLINYYYKSKIFHGVFNVIGTKHYEIALCCASYPGGACHLT